MTDKDKIKKLIEALKYYADPMTYYEHIVLIPNEPTWANNGNITDDLVYEPYYGVYTPGKKAINVLNEVAPEIMKQKIKDDEDRLQEIKEAGCKYYKRNSVSDLINTVNELNGGV